MFLWGGAAKRVARFSEELKDGSPEKRRAALQGLTELAAKNVEDIAPAVPAILAAASDADQSVRFGALALLRTLGGNNSDLLKGHFRELIGMLERGGEVRVTGVTLLLHYTRRRPEALKGRREVIPFLLDAVESESGRPREDALALIERAGFSGKEYIQNLETAKEAITASEAAGGAVSEHRKLIESAKGAAREGDMEKFRRLLDAAREGAGRARRVVVLFEMELERVRCVAVSRKGRYIAAGLEGRKVLLLNREGTVLWRHDLPEAPTDLRFDLNENTLVAGGSDGTLFAFGIEGQLLWKFKTGGPVKCLAPASGGVVLASSADNNIYRVEGGGKTFSKHWTEKPVWRLSATGGLEIIATTSREHTIVCYDREMFLKWRFMGGIWNDVSVAPEGGAVAGGTQGNEVYFLNGNGSVLWRAKLDSPVLRICAAGFGLGVVAADERSLYDFGGDGHPLWRLRALPGSSPQSATQTGQKAPPDFVDLASSLTSEYIAVTSGKFIALLYNREAGRLLALQADPDLARAKALGVNVAPVEGWLVKAREAYGRNDFQDGAEMVRNGRRALREQKTARAKALVDAVEAAVEAARASGTDTSHAESTFSRARHLLGGQDIDGALAALTKAMDEVRRAHEVRQAIIQKEVSEQKAQTKLAIQRAIAMVDEAVEFGIDAAGMEELLQEAIAASDGDDFDRCLRKVHELEVFVDRAKADMPRIAAANYEKACETLKKPDLTTEEGEDVRTLLGGAVVFYERTGDNRKLAECYERLGYMEERRRKVAYAKFLYQKAVNALFKLGEFDSVMVLLMDKLRKLEGVREEVPGDFVVEDLFLIYRDGRLITHNTRRLRPDVDSQILSGMLVAIQGFVRDSLTVRGDDRGEVDEVKYGKNRILIERGKFVYLALVVSGQESEELRERMRRTVREIGEKYAAILEAWDGDVGKLWGARKMVDALLE